MRVFVNGEPTELPADQTVAELVAHLGLTGKAVAVEVNRQVVPRRLHEATPLREGDRIEVVTLVGGG